MVDILGKITKSEADEVGKDQDIEAWTDLLSKSLLPALPK